MSERLPPFNKALLINGTILLALLFEYFRGITILVLVIYAILIFTAANIAMWLKSRSLKSKDKQH
jgi:hypothetical protein